MAQIMTTLDHLEQRALSAAMGLRNDMLAAGMATDLLPVDEISVTKTDDGVTIKFIKSAPKKTANAPKQKAENES